MSTPRPSRLSTPGRPSLGGAGASGLPTPSRRKVSVGPSSLASSSSTSLHSDQEANDALLEVLRTRPPSSMDKSHLASAGEPGQQQFNTPPNNPAQRYGGLGASTTGPALPRTPASMRSRVPSSGASLSASTSKGFRNVLGASTSTATATSTPGRSVSSVHTPRRTSMAAPQTPNQLTQASLRSRQSLSQSVAARPPSVVPTSAFDPDVGDAVRIKSMGMEGTVRYVGHVEGKEGIFVGVELDPGFEGRGKNDGSVDGKQYFECKPLSGVFTQKAKLSPPEVRPASVASSHRSLASGRMTPAHSIRSGASGRETPYISEDGEAGSSRTPSKASLPLGKTTRNNVMQPPPVSQITVGSRASALMNTNAKQLAAQKALRATEGSLGGRESPSTPGTVLSRSTTTPRPPRFSTTSVSTPSRVPSVSRRFGRESVGGAGSTPSAPRNGRMSVSGRASVTPSIEMMPPPPSPGKYGRVTPAPDSRLEEMKMINSELLDKIQALEGSTAGASAEKKETDQRMKELKIASEFASKEASQAKIKIQSLEEELQAMQQQLEAQSLKDGSKDEAIKAAEAGAAKLKREIEIERERAAEELERSMANKRQELKKAEEKINQLQSLADEKEALVMEVSKDARYAVEAYEVKLGDANVKRFALENTVRSLEDQLVEALRRATESSSAENVKSADTAAQIDNENLKAQVAHQQKKIASLEDQIEELQVQIEKDGENTLKIIEKAKESDRRLREDIATARAEILNLREAVSKGKDRVAELEHALKDQASTLAGAQAEIESNRVDLADLENLRMAQDLHDRNAKDQESLLRQIKDLKAKNAELESDLAKLTKGYTDLREGSRKPRMSSGPVDAEKSLRGFQHIIQDLNGENADLKQKILDFQVENDALKENLALLESAIDEKIATEEEKLNAEENGYPEAKAELQKVQSRLAQLETEKLQIEQHYRQTIKEQNREIQELESLVESKIYREDELERTLEDLRRDQQANVFQDRHLPRPASASTVRSSASAIICPLCDGEHDLEDCQLAKSGEDDNSSPLMRKSINSRQEPEAERVWCDNCDTSAHATVDCPQADDMF